MLRLVPSGGRDVVKSSSTARPGVRASIPVPGVATSKPSFALPGTLLLQALAWLLRPLVRLCLRSSVTFPVLADLLRTLFVTEAQRELSDARLTDSRLSLMTGVHRKEIRRLRGLAPEQQMVSEAVTLTSEVVARWLGTVGMTDHEGRPVPLPRVSAPGEPSFEALVESVTTDLRPRAVLDAWLDQGIAAMDPGGRVRLLPDAFVARPGRADQLFFFGRNLHDHLAAAAGNLLAVGTAPFPDASVHYDGLAPDVAARLEAVGREAAGRLLLDVNRAALALVDAAPPACRRDATGEPGRLPLRRERGGGRPAMRLSLRPALLLAHILLAGTMLVSCGTSEPASAPVAAGGFCRIGPDGGPLLAERGIGGTGGISPGPVATPAGDAPGGSVPSTPRPGGRGIGGTGIVGVITGFGSVCVDGLEVALDPEVTVSVDGEPAAVSTLRAGQLVALRAADAKTTPHTDVLAVRHEVVGQVQSIADGILVVAGQRVLTGARTRGVAHPTVGSRVAVSGLRDVTGAVVATRVDVGAAAYRSISARGGVSNTAAGKSVLIRGRLTHDGSGLRIGELLVSLVAGLAVPDDGPVTATGSLDGYALHAATLMPDLLAADPVAYFGSGVDRYVIESYTDPVTGRLLLGRTLRGNTEMQAGRSVMAFERSSSGTVVVSTRSPDAAAATFGLPGPPMGDAGLSRTRTGAPATKEEPPGHGTGSTSSTESSPGGGPPSIAFTPAPIPQSASGSGQDDFNKAFGATPFGAGSGRSGPFVPGMSGGPSVLSGGGSNGTLGGSGSPGPHR